MIASVHIADVDLRTALRLLRGSPHARKAPGLRFGATTLTAPLSGAFPPPTPRLRRTALIAFWEQESALEAFLAEHPVAGDLARGWHVRLEPTRHVHAFHELTDLPSAPAMRPEEPAAVLTLGRTRFGRGIHRVPAPDYVPPHRRRMVVQRRHPHERPQRTVQAQARRECSSRSPSSASAGCGLASRYPCPAVQPRVRRVSSCVDVSTPSAMTPRSSALARARMALAIAPVRLSWRLATNDRSIFSIVSGSLLSWLKDE